ncbi:MAG: hypothetical protein SO434_03365 [Eubacteriales bacterium]|nr:hypothetical protein [Eubacteriales bacterium]
MDDNQKLKEFIHQWATKYHYFDEEGTLKDCALYDVGYDLKPAIEDSPFNDAPEGGYDFWYDLFFGGRHHSYFN